MTSVSRLRVCAKQFGGYDTANVWKEKCTRHVVRHSAQFVHQVSKLSVCELPPTNPTILTRIHMIFPRRDPTADHQKRHSDSRTFCCPPVPSPRQQSGFLTNCPTLSLLSNLSRRQVHRLGDPLMLNVLQSYSHHTLHCSKDQRSP